MNTTKKVEPKWILVSCIVLDLKILRLLRLKICTVKNALKSLTGLSDRKNFRSAKV